MTKNNDVVLIDTSDKKDANAIIDSLEKYEFEDIDLLVLSHPHADHIRGTESLLDKYNVKTVVMPSYVATSKLFESMLDKFELLDIEVIAAEDDLVLNIDEVTINILASDLIPNDCNNSSVIVKATYGETDILYTGDMEESGESKLLGMYLDLSSEILKVGHHGSATSTSEDFLAKVSPSYAIISVGEGNKYKHPSNSTLDLLNKKGIITYRTDIIGNILFELDGLNKKYVEN